MARALAGRVAHAVSVLFAISVLVFLIFFATPGADPAARLAGRGASPATLAAIHTEFGLGQPLPVQYARLMRRLFITQDLASSANRGQRVVPAILHAAPVTLSLAIGAAILWLVAGLGAGLLAAALPGSLIDRLVVTLGLLGLSIPVFWLGEVVNLVTQSRFHDTWLFRWVPPLGYQPLAAAPLAWFKALLLPWATLALLYAGLYGRVLRASLLDAYDRDYIRTARAKGLGETYILLRHALRTSLLTVVALFGLDFGALVGGGTLLTEVVFGLRGVGKLTFDALQNLDLPLVMATVTYSSFFVVIANAAVDFAQIALDPRLRAD